MKGVKSFAIKKRSAPGDFLLTRFDEARLQQASGQQATVVVRPELEKFRDGVVMREIERTDRRIQTRNDKGQREARKEHLIQVCDGWSIKHGEEATPQDLQLYEGAQDDEQPEYAVFVRDTDDSGNLLDSYTAYAVDEAWTFLKQSTVKRQTAEQAEEEFLAMRAAGPKRSRMGKYIERMQQMDSVSEQQEGLVRTMEDEMPAMNDESLETGAGDQQKSISSSSASKASTSSGAAASSSQPRYQTANREGIATAVLQTGELGSQALRDAQAGQDLVDDEVEEDRRARQNELQRLEDDGDIVAETRFGATSLEGFADVDFREQFDDDEGVDADLMVAESQALGHEVAREDELAVGRRVVSGGASGWEDEDNDAILGGEGEEMTDEAADAAERARAFGASSSSRYQGKSQVEMSALGAVASSSSNNSSSTAGVPGGDSAQASGRKRGAPDSDGTAGAGRGDAPTAKRARSEAGAPAAGEGSSQPAASTAGILRTAILDLLERSGGRVSKRNLTRLLRRLQRKHGDNIKIPFPRVLSTLAKREASGTDVFYVQIKKRV